MVGVPGRSKGCNTCIRRKVKCDQAAPHCGNCRKSNRLCTGYERKVSYVFSDDVNLSESDRSALSRQPETTAAVTCSRRSKKAAAAAAAAQGPRKFTFLSYGAPRPSAEEQAPGRHHQHRMLAMPCGKALRSQFHAIFMDRQLPDELLGVRYSVSGSGGGGGVDELTGNWLAYLQGRAVDSPALEMALAAFMAANVGEMNRDDDLVARSRDMYAQGVGCLREALADRRTRLSDEALAACMALSLYELSVDQDPASAYKTHLLGAMALLQMRGPDGINSPLWHSLFLGLRRQIIMGSIAHHRSTFLSSPEWRHRPFQHFGKSHLDELFDLILDLPTILQTWDSIRHDNNSTAATLRVSYAALIASARRLHADLEEWHAGFERKVSGPLHWPRFSTVACSRDDDADLGKVVPVALHFPSFGVAQRESTYWTGMMILHKVLQCAHEALAAMEDVTTSPPGTKSPDTGAEAAAGRRQQQQHAARARDHRAQWAALIRSLCQCTEFLAQDEMGVAGSVVALSVLHGAKRSVAHSGEPGWGRELAWIAEVTQRVQATMYLPMEKIFQD